MDKIVVTAFLVIAGVISVVFAFNSIFPAVVSSSEAMTSMERRIDERLKTQIKIINVSQSGTTVTIWIKNIGSARVLAPESCDLFFGPQGNFARIPYGSGTPNWTYTIENDSDWNQSATVRVSVAYGSVPPAGTYYVKMVLTNGVSDEYMASW